MLAPDGASTARLPSATRLPAATTSVALSAVRVAPRSTSAALPIRFDVDLDVADGDWAVVRVLDPAGTMPGGDATGAAGSAFEGLGRAVAYASPIFLDPDADADASAEAMQREVISGVR